MTHFKFWKHTALILVVLLIGGLAASSVMAQQPDAIPLRVEAAVTGRLDQQNPSVTYSFNVYESTRMAFVFDTDGDVEVTLSVLGHDGVTILASAIGAANNGLVVEFPAQGTYYVMLVANSGTAATYRLMIDADPALPTNAFVAQSYLARGTSTQCAENTPTTFFSANEDLNVCFALALVDQPVDFIARWYAPDGQIVVEESATLGSGDNFVPYLTGLVYDGQTPWTAGWWQVHFIINGELSHIQWVTVTE